MALVLVLAALALISFLVLVILTMARTEDRTSTAAAEISDVRTLADMPAQLVISQIRRATSTQIEDGSLSSLGVDVTWASQPGMIRQYTTSGAAIEGTPRVKAFACFKLYSSSRMTVDGESFDPAKEAQSFQNWESAPALYTDLNQAVMKTPVRTATNTSNKAGEEPKFIYPILDPSAVNSVEGFEITGTPPGSDTAKKRPLPMPALWLYVLKDGRVVAPASGSGPNASFSNGPTKDNPIVGRIAFWTDDESCKLNLNTASEPAPWDTPRTNSKQDHLYAERQPARNEFHRQSGHPAYTALSPVFKSFTGKSTGSGVTNSVFTPKPDPIGRPGEDTAFNDYINAVHHLLPRTVTTEAGSYNGTKDNEPRNAAVTKRQRLYTTVDELLFSTDLDSERRRLPNSSSPSGTGYQVMEEDVRKARFFLTTRSAAPETTPFNRPKISLWTVQSDPAEQTDLDRAMMFAASTADASGQRVPYFFQRAKSWTSESDPGSSDPGSSQSPSADALLDRNARILGAMQTFAAYGVPGYASASVDTKYGVMDRDRLLISMFDMLRWGVNYGNADRDLGSTYSYMPQSLQFGEYSAAPAHLGETGRTTEKGIGRFPTVTELAMVFVASDVEKSNAKPTNQDGDPKTYDKTTKVRMFFFMEPFLSAVGSPGVTPAVRYKVRWDKPAAGPNEPWKLATKTLGFLGDEKLGLVSRVRYSSNKAIAGKALGGNSTAFHGLALQFLNREGAERSLIADPSALGEGDHESDYPFVSSEVELSNSQDQAGNLEFSGGDITLEIRTGADAAPGEQVQNIRIKVPAFTIPVPKGSANPANDWEGLSQGNSLANRFRLQDLGDGQLRQRLIVEGDVVRSLVLDSSAGTAAPSDPRVLAARYDVPEEWFKMAVPFAADQREAQNLRNTAFTGGGNYGYSGTGTDGRRLDSEVSARFLGSGHLPDGTRPIEYLAPAAPADGTGLMGSGRFGDWENGPGLLEDGAYVSRFDFGNSLMEREAPGTAAAPIGGYFQRGGIFKQDDHSLNLAPFRQISSAITFGSLPSQASDRPMAWTTLLFCPNPNARMTPANPSAETELGDHFGFGGTSGGTRLPDHLWLEHFWMPVVEPRPLSAGFSTEGKVNMNYQIMPFTWIKRATAMHGALQGVRITAIPSADAMDQAYNDGHHYKASKAPGQVLDKQYRYAVNAKETLKAFDEQRFAKGDLFRTPSEICEMFLVPKRLEGHEYGGVADPANVKWTEMTQWWNGAPGDPLVVDAFEATGDNTREAPYAQLYPRLCTRSNVYRVHFRVQLLKKSRATNPAEWDETKDQVAAEYRGSSVVERYLDPHDKTIPDMIGTINSSDALDDYFRYRVVERQPFAP